MSRFWNYACNFDSNTAFFNNLPTTVQGDADWKEYIDDVLHERTTYPYTPEDVFMYFLFIDQVEQA